MPDTETLEPVLTLDRGKLAKLDDLADQIDIGVAGLEGLTTLDPSWADHETEVHTYLDGLVATPEEAVVCLRGVHYDLRRPRAA